jgi:hypothetical protein
MAPERPAARDLQTETIRGWFLDTPGAVVTKEKAETLLAQAVRGQAGGIFVPGYIYPPPTDWISDTVGRRN